MWTGFQKCSGGGGGGGGVWGGGGGGGGGGQTKSATVRFFPGSAPVSRLEFNIFTAITTFGFPSLQIYRALPTCKATAKYAQLQLLPK